MLRSLIVLMVLLGATGCHRRIVVNDIVVWDHLWNKATSEVGSRASFALSCPKQALALTLLNRHGRYPSEVGVSGCGQRAIYRTLQPGGPGGMWTRDQ
jgi:hypothetical protein